IFVPMAAGASSNDYANCAIAVISTASTLAGYAQNVNIEKNQVEGKNCILVSSINPSAGLSARGIYINKNIVSLGMIGYAIIGSNANNMNSSECLRVSNNTTIAIIWANSEGRYTTSSGTDHNNLGNGNIIIDKNTAVFIRGVALGNTSKIKSVLKILHNTLIMSQSISYTAAWLITSPMAIICSGQVSALNSTHVNIEGNTINSPLSIPDIYSWGIYCDPQGTIRGNFIDGFSTRGIEAGFSSKVIISQNTINRNGQSIDCYIKSNGDIVVDNIFDSRTIDGTDTQTIDSSSTCVVDRNVNHLVTTNANLYNTLQPWGSSTSSFEYNSDGSNIWIQNSSPPENLREIHSYGDGYGVFATFATTGSLSDVVALINPAAFIPPGAKLVQAWVRVNSTNSDWDGGNFVLQIHTKPSTLIGSSSINLNAIVSSQTIYVTPSSEQRADNLFVKLFINNPD